MSNKNTDGSRTFTNEQLVDLIQSGEDRDGSYMLQLWQQVRRYAWTIAKRYSSYAPMDDLMQECFLSLYDSVSNYDPAAGSFLTYAGQWFRQRMIRSIQDTGRVIRLPVFKQQQLTQYKRLTQKYQTTLNRKPTAKEIGIALGLSDIQVQRLIDDVELVTVASLDSPLGSGDEDAAGATLSDLVEGCDDVEDDVLDRVQQEQLKTVLWQQVDDLPGQQGATLRMRYQQGLTLKEAAERLERTPERVRQIQAKALRELRKPSRAKHLKPFLDDVYSDGLRGNGIGSFSRSWTSSTERAALRLADRGHTGSRTARF